MTVSAITSVTFTMNEIIEEAFDVIGVGAEGETLSADMYRRGRNSLRLMNMTWNTYENLWRKERDSLAMVAGQAAYVITPKPMRVTSARRKLTLGGYETPMTEWSRQTYLDQPNKDSSPSTPVNYYYDPQRDVGTVYLWPAPQAAVAAANTIELDLLRPMFIVDLSNQSLDMPVEWQETVIYNLAKRLKLKYPVNDPRLSAEIDDMADMLFAQLKGFDNEEVSIYLQPEARWG